MSVVELHSRNAVAPDLIHPDRVIFDRILTRRCPRRRCSMRRRSPNSCLTKSDSSRSLRRAAAKDFILLFRSRASKAGSRSKGFRKLSRNKWRRSCPITVQQSWARETGLAKSSSIMRNCRGASTVAPFSIKARPGVAVSMPIAWDELKDVTGGDRWSMSSALARQRSLNNDPWDGYWRTRQGITVAMQRAIGMRR